MSGRILLALLLAASTAGCASYTAEKWPCKNKACAWAPINQRSVVVE